MTIATQATLAALLAKVPADPATGTGQASTGTKLDTLHSDLTSLAPKGASTNIPGTIAAANATVDGTTDLSGYGSVRVQITGTFVGTITFQSSVDGTNWVTLGLSGGASGGLFTTATTTGVWSGNLSGRYFRLNGTAWTSGTATTSILYTTTVTTQSLNTTSGAINARLTDGTNAPAVKAASTAAAATDPSLVVAFHPSSPLPAGSAKIGLPAQGSKHAATLAATTNATTVSAGSLNLYTVTISNLGAATIYWKLFDKASAPTVGTDVPIAVIPVAASSYQSVNFGTTGQRLASGLAYSVTGAIATTDTTAVTAGSLVALTYA